MVALINPQKAVLNPNGSPRSKGVYEALGKEGLKLFKDIFRNNNRKVVDMFLSHDFIKLIWPVIIQDITYQ